MLRNVFHFFMLISQIKQTKLFLLPLLRVAIRCCSHVERVYSSLHSEDGQSTHIQATKLVLKLYPSVFLLWVILTLCLRVCVALLWMRLPVLCCISLEKSKCHCPHIRHLAIQCSLLVKTYIHLLRTICFQKTTIYTMGKTAGLDGSEVYLDSDKAGVTGTPPTNKIKIWL